MTVFSLGKEPRVVRGKIGPHDSVTLDLPFPPSVNNLFANGSRGRFPTQQYRDWQSAAGWKLLADRPSRIPGPVRITFQFEEKAGRRDLDNLQKAPLDLLVKHNVIDGDHRSVVRELHASWSSTVQGVRITIEPVAIAKVAA